MHSLSPELWERLAALRAGGGYDAEFHAAWANGQAFLAADDGLRGRLPKVVEWKGTGRAPGDEVAPIDLRVDHVYLVSCKYLSKILFNVSPSHVFDGLLVGGSGRGARATRAACSAGVGDWYAEVAPAEYQALYESVRRAAVDRDGAAPTGRSDVLPRPREAPDRAPAAPALPGLGAVDAAADAAAAAAAAPGPCPGPGSTSAPRAHRPDCCVSCRPVPSTCPRTSATPSGVGSARAGRRMPRRSTPPCPRRWRGRRCGAGRRPWTVARVRARPCCGGCSASAAPPTSSWAPPRPARCGCASRRRGTGAGSTSWSPSPSSPSPAGNPASAGRPWCATRVSHDLHAVAGHIEVRWSHGRFGGLPEAKGYLDTPHHLVPGYVTLR